METAGGGAPRALSSSFQSASSLPFSIIMSSVAFGAITIDSINRLSAAPAVSFSFLFQRFLSSEFARKKREAAFGSRRCSARRPRWQQTSAATLRRASSPACRLTGPSRSVREPDDHFIFSFPRFQRDLTVAKFEETNEESASIQSRTSFPKSGNSLQIHPCTRREGPRSRSAGA